MLVVVVVMVVVCLGCSCGVQEDVWRRWARSAPDRLHRVLHRKLLPVAEALFDRVLLLLLVVVVQSL